MKQRAKKTALVLSGGGSRGAYQVGAWRALEELGWTFDMVIGVSVGSLNGAMVVQNERILAENLWRELGTDNIFDVNKDAQIADFALEFIKQGGAGSGGLKKFVDKYIDDFLRNIEADKSGSKTYILDSRLAWHFVPSSFKVYLTVRPEIAAERVMNDHKRTG